MIIGLIPLIQNILSYSVNTWNPGFLDKLYASTNPVGIISEMLITLLNANSHVYHVSPALTTIENVVSKRLAQLLGMGEVSIVLYYHYTTTDYCGSLLKQVNIIFPKVRLINRALIIYCHLEIRRNNLPWWCILKSIGDDYCAKSHVS